MTPLHGLKVVELARVLAGDDTRKWGPPFVERGDDRSAAYFHGTNRGKASVVADLKTEAGQALVRDLVADADVLIENFKVGGLAKYGLDYDTLSRLNPRLVYCSITGFGQSGPYASRAGYDFIIQGMSGLMSVTGEPDGQPQKTGVAITDIFTGLYSVIAIQAALHHREVTGRGQHIDMALLDSAVAIMANQSMNYLVTGQAPRKLGNAHPNLMPYQVFDCADGWIIIAVGNDGQYRKLCDVLRVPELGVLEAYATNAGRVTHREELTELLSGETRKWSMTDLLAACEAAGVPAGPINDMAGVFADPQVIARGMQVSDGEVPGVRTPIVFSDAELAEVKAAPALDADGARIRSDQDD